MAAVALGGAAFGFDGRVGAALFDQFETSFAAGLDFAVELLGDGSGAANFAQGENFDFEFAAVIFDAEEIAGTDVARGLGGLALEVDAAELAGSGGQGAGFEKAGGPQPFIHAEAVHLFILALPGTK